MLVSSILLLDKPKVRPHTGLTSSPPTGTNIMAHIITITTWFQKTYGNTYHSVSVKDAAGGTIACLAVPFAYGDADHAEQITIKAMRSHGLLPSVGPIAPRWKLEQAGVLFIKNREVSRKRDL